MKVRAEDIRGEVWAAIVRKPQTQVTFPSTLSTESFLNSYTAETNKQSKSCEMCSPKLCAPAMTQVCDRNAGQQINEKALTGNSESYREKASHLLTDELKLYSGRFWTDFRHDMSLGQFEALLQMLSLV